MLMPPDWTDGRDSMARRDIERELPAVDPSTRKRFHSSAKARTVTKLLTVWNLEMQLEQFGEPFEGMRSDLKSVLDEQFEHTSFKRTRVRQQAKALHADRWQGHRCRHSTLIMSIGLWTGMVTRCPRHSPTVAPNI